MSTLQVGTISEKVTDAGVAIDGVTLKDGGGTFTGAISGTDMELLHTTTVTSNVGQVVIDGHFTSAFKNYKVIGSNIHLSTDNVHLNCKFMSGGSLLTGSNHRSSTLQLISSNDTLFHLREQSDTEFAKAFGAKYGNATGENGNFEMIIYDPLSTDNRKMFQSDAMTVDNNKDARMIKMIGTFDNGEVALSGIEIDPSSGDIASGVFKLYGLR